MSDDKVSKSFIHMNDMLKELNMINFELDNLEKKKASILGKKYSYKRKFDIVANDIEYYDCSKKTQEYVKEGVKTSKTY